MPTVRDDYYAVLGVDRDASQDEIKRAYRRLTLEFHPDRQPGDVDAQERFRQINRAYDTLGDAQARSRYDAALLLPDGFDVSNLNAKKARDLLGNVLGDVLGTRRRRRRRGRDLRYTLTVSLTEAALGSTHRIEFDAPGPCESCGGTGQSPGGRPAQPCDNCGGKGEIRRGLLWSRCGRCDGTGMVHPDPCRTCRGRGTTRGPRAFDVRIPEGTDSGAERVLSGQGEPGRFGGEPGDLRVTVNVKAHPSLKRDGETISSDVYVSLGEAVRGAQVPVVCLDGTVWVDIPQGVRSGTRMRLRGKGVPRAGGRGDHIVTVKIETPRGAASKELGRILDQLDALVSKDPSVLPRRAEQRAATLDQPARSGASASGQSAD